MAHTERTRPPLEDVVTSAARRLVYESARAWDDTTLPGQLARHAREKPDAVAVVDSGGARTFTYAQLDKDSARVAAYLRARGVGPGEVVSVQLPNWYETVAVDLAVLRTGAVLNPLLPLYRGRELHHMLSRSGARFIFTPRVYRGHDFEEMIAGLRPTLPDLLGHMSIADPEAGGLSGWVNGVDADGGERPRDARTVSELIFTSGTEAAPKAIMHTEETTNFGVRSLWASIGMGTDEVVWMPSPIGHSTGLNFGVRPAVYFGIPLVLQDRWSATEAVELSRRFGISYTLAATTFLADLVAEATRTGADVSSLRHFGSGGAPVPPTLVEAAHAAGIEVLRLYGSTELLCATWNRPHSPLEKRVWTDGLALEGTELEVRDDDGDVVRDQPGVIFGRSPSACVGFFDDPVRTGETFDADGWVMSGDIGVIDDEGYLTIVGRRKEIIIRGGLNIAPRELEELIVQIPEVRAAAVVGLPHERLGEIVCACVVLAEGGRLDLDALVARLRSRAIATYKLPQAMVQIDGLPMTSTGKVRKHALVEQIAGGSLVPERSV